MKILVRDMFPKFEFASCAYCGTLFGYTEDEPESLKGQKSNQEILTLVCPSCNNLLILPPPPQEPEYSITVSNEDIHYDLLFDDDDEEGDEYDEE